MPDQLCPGADFTIVMILVEAGVGVVRHRQTDISDEVLKRGGEDRSTDFVRLQVLRSHFIEFGLSQSVVCLEDLDIHGRFDLLLDVVRRVVEVNGGVIYADVGIPRAFELCLSLKLQQRCFLFALLSQLLYLFSLDLFVTVEPWHGYFAWDGLASLLFGVPFNCPKRPLLSTILLGLLPVASQIVVGDDILAPLDEVVGSILVDVGMMRARDPQQRRELLHRHPILDDVLLLESADLCKHLNLGRHDQLAFL